MCRTNPTACSGQDQDPSNETIVATSFEFQIPSVQIKSEFGVHDKKFLEAFASVCTLLVEAQHKNVRLLPGKHGPWTSLSFEHFRCFEFGPCVRRAKRFAKGGRGEIKEKSL